MTIRENTGRRGFTIVEILVTIGIIGILMSLVLPALNTARKSARLTVSQNNMRQISVGLSLFSIQQKDEIISPNTEKVFNAGGSYGIVKCRAWVHAKDGETVEVVTEPGGGRTYGIESRESLRQGFAWPFIGGGSDDGGIYRSPLDPTDRVRSYSLNGAIGHVPDLGFMWLLEDLGIQTAPARSLGHVRNPDKTLYVIPEEMNGQIGNIPDGGWNLHGWILDFNQSRWIDVPAFWAIDGINLAFMDGHVDYHLWEDRELRKQVRTNHTIYPGEDFDYMISIMMPGLEHLLEQ